MKRLLFAFCLIAATLNLSAQVKVYKFSKAFIEEHYKKDSAIGILHADQARPAATVHPRSCDGKDGELHIGIEGDNVRWSKQGQEAISAPSNGNGDFGLVAEPPNITSAAKTKIQGFGSQPMEFFGYFRLWNEGHDVGNIAPSNPHHVLELHPTWALHSGDQTMGTAGAARIVAAIPNFSGYGASKFVPVLSTIKSWLKVAEDDESVYVQLAKADNFYQLPVVVKGVKPVTGGVSALVDVFSDLDRRLVYSNLTVMMAPGSRIASQVTPNKPMYLLGIFSVNLAKAEMIAHGHGKDAPVSGAGALEFFAFGVPLEHAVASSACDPEEPED